MDPDDPQEPELLDLRSLSREQHAELRAKVIASLCGFHRLDMETRADVADGAIEQVLRSGRMDPKGNPVGYIKTTAKRLAVRLDARLQVERSTSDSSALELAAHKAACRDGRYEDQQFGPASDGVHDVGFWGPTDDEENVARVQDAISSIPAAQVRAVPRGGDAGSVPSRWAVRRCLTGHRKTVVFLLRGARGLRL
ncbi:hypothetical protein [Streptomyces sp. NBC_01276]|uniref:hypothetical protein n=1 Tax=Streptomyces sp. NBC_01276 TaxID=2903808 RepID=UPI00352D743B